MRAYANDNVQVRVLVGAHIQPHSFQIQGVRWNYEPQYPESGFKNAQAMGISEHFEMLFKLPPAGADHQESKGSLLSFADYLVSPSSSVDGLANGNWGIMRAFNQPVGDAPPGPTHLALPNNPTDELAAKKQALADKLAEYVRTSRGSAGHRGRRCRRITAPSTSPRPRPSRPFPGAC